MDNVLIDKTISQKIEHVLSIYPHLSPSMLQTGIGTAIPPAIWRPVLQRLISEGIVIESEEVRETPTGRHHLYTILSLYNNNYRPVLYKV